MKKFYHFLFAFLLASVSFAQIPSLLKDITTGTLSSTPNTFRYVGSHLLFVASDTTNGTEWRKTDGTSAGTQLLKDILPGKSSSLIQWMVNLNNDTLLFTVNDSVVGNELWMTDGTVAGTHLVKDIWPGPSNSDPNGLLAMNGRVYFFANDSTHGQELWMTDGTAVGTVLIKDINTSPTSGSFASGLTRLNDTMLFSATDAINGYELWRSDGTISGTYLLKDLLPGGSSFPGMFRSLGNICIFTADSTGVGNELWVLPACNGLDVSLTGTNAMTGPSTGLVTSTLTGGTSPFSYSWSSAQTTTSITGLIAGKYILTVTDTNGCVTIDSVTIINTTGIADVQRALAVQVINDHMQQQLRVSIDDVYGSANYTVSLHNALGQRVYENAIHEKSFSIPVNNFARGAYFLSINSGGAQKPFVQKVVLD